MIKTLTLEVNNAINLFSENGMIVNTDKLNPLSSRMRDALTNSKIGNNKVDFECFVIECFRNQHLH